MPNPNVGMLSALFAPQPDDEDAKIRAYLTQLDPVQRSQFIAQKGANDVGRALGGLALSETGRDPRQPQQVRADAIAQAKAQVQKLGLSPDNPESVDAYYKAVMQILQKQGMAPEALALSREWEDVKKERAETGKAERANQLKGKDALVARRDALAEKLSATPDDPDLQAQMKNVDTALEKFYPSQKWHYGAGNEYSDPIMYADDGTTKPIQGYDKQMNPAQRAKLDAKKDSDAVAYALVKNDMQRQYDAVWELYNHKGLNGIYGPLNRNKGADGLAGSAYTAVFSNADEGRAIELHKSVMGGSLMQGLATLKNQSKTGASGLGQLSESEGAQVRADAASIGRTQAGPDGRKALATYAKGIEERAKILDAQAAKDGVPLRPLQTKPFGAAAVVRGKVQTAAAPADAGAPAAAPSAAPAAPAGAPVRRKFNPETGRLE